MTHHSTQRGDALVIAMLATGLFCACVVVALIFNQWRTTLQHNTSQANGLAQLRDALQAYATANKTSLTTGKILTGVADQLHPTMIELQDLGYLTGTALSLAESLGTNYATALTIQPSNAISGLVYLNGNVIGPNGAPDPARACAIAGTLGDTGVCCPPNNPQFLGNNAIQMANPSLQPASIGALIYVAP